MQYLRRYLPGTIILAALLIAGLATYRDYGISWDEPAQRLVGTVNYDYVFHGDKRLFIFDDKRYGPGFELPLICIEKALHLTDTRDIYLMRHLADHLFFLLGAFFGYLLCYRLFKSQFIACTGFLMLALMPRFYAHSFFNTKDIPFLSALLIATYGFTVALERRRPLGFLLAGVLLGYATSIRIMGVLPTFIVGFFLLTDVAMAAVRKDNAKRNAGALLCFAAGYCLCLYACSPYLWSNPIPNFIDCYSKLTIHGPAVKNLMNGGMVSTAALPWTYLPEWMLITIPVLWSALGIGGIILLLINIARKPSGYITNTPERMFLMYFLMLIAPVVSFYVFTPPIYDEWRHLYFIYIFLVLMGVYCLSKLAPASRRIVQFACAVQAGFVCWFMVKSHPFQQVYFNHLVSHKKEYLRKNFEFDYWGSSVKQALDYLIASNPTRVYQVNCGWPPYITNNMMLLKPADRQRIQQVEFDQCDYFITNFRYHPDDFDFPMIYSRTVLNSTVVCIYKMH